MMPAPLWVRLALAAFVLPVAWGAFLLYSRAGGLTPLVAAGGLLVLAMMLTYCAASGRIPKILWFVPS
jgi:hypothetical protein